MKKVLVLIAIAIGAMGCDKPADSESLIGKINSGPIAKGTTTTFAVSIGDDAPGDYVLPNEIVIVEQALSDGFDIAPPMILSYWIDFKGYDDGTHNAGFKRCEDRGGEPIGWYSNLAKAMIYKCENIDY